MKETPFQENQRLRARLNAICNAAFATLRDEDKVVQPSPDARSSGTEQSVRPPDSGPQAAGDQRGECICTSFLPDPDCSEHGMKKAAGDPERHLREALAERDAEIAKWRNIQDTECIVDRNDWLVLETAARRWRAVERAVERGDRIEMRHTNDGLLIKMTIFDESYPFKGGRISTTPTLAAAVDALADRLDKEAKP